MTSELELKIRAWVSKSEGWMTPERALEMAQLIIDRKPETVVELGVFGGRSLISQGLALKENNKGMIYGVDPWWIPAALEGENDANKEWWAKVDLNHIHQLCMNGIWDHGLQDHVTVVRQTSQNAARMFKKIDVLWIDGNHAEEASCRDVSLYVPNVVMGGHVLFDDCLWPSTQAAQKLMLKWCEVVKDGGEYKLFKKVAW